jgi:3'-phosphoadenosine 5'-phosphosulfate sulfotransferase (PAPS reductase)/FAD synthetase
MSETLKHVVGFSGGIDSQACARWVLNRFPAEDVILLNSDAGGNEHPLTTEFVEWYSANVHPVVMVTPIIADLGGRGSRPGAIKDRRNEFAETDQLTFDRLAYVKGMFPMRKAQFCTEHLKLAPAHRWMKENLRDAGLTWRRYAGVRRDESQGRKYRKPLEWDDYFLCELHLPIVDWTKQMAFDYVQAHGEKINERYTLGFGRVGCAPCINSNKEDVLAWSQRFPEMIDKVRVWEKRVGRTFFAPMVPGLEINWIDQVVDWAKTCHGGKQYSLLTMIQRPACESEYGLCE